MLCNADEWLRIDVEDMVNIVHWASNKTLNNNEPSALS